MSNRFSSNLLPTRRLCFKGFTLVELLVVIAIIGVLVGLLLPAVQAAREAARRMSCSNNLKQIGLALHNYHDTHGVFPPGFVNANSGYNTPADNWADNTNGLAWSALVLPFMEQAPLYDQLKAETGGFARHWQRDFNWAMAEAPSARVGIASYSCPSDTMGPINNKRGNYGKNNYLGNSGNAAAVDRRGIFWTGSRVLIRDILDGTSNTVMVVERSGTRSLVDNSCGTNRCDWNAGLWIGARTIGGANGWSPGLASTDVDSYGGGNATYLINRSAATWGNSWGNSSLHPGGLQWTLCDGSTRFVSETIDMITYRNLRWRESGQPIGEY